MEFIFYVYWLNESFCYYTRKEAFDKLHFTLDNAIGLPLGSLFEVKGGKLNRLDLTEDVDELLAAKDDVGKWGLLYTRKIEWNLYLAVTYRKLWGDRFHCIGVLLIKKLK